jgi:hypothetical protein
MKRPTNHLVRVSPRTFELVPREPSGNRTAARLGASAGDPDVGRGNGGREALGGSEEKL